MKLCSSYICRTTAALSLVLVAVTFQNCGKAPMSPGDQATSEDFQKIEASQFSNMVVHDEVSRKNLSVDLNSGVIEVSSNAGSQQKCLTLEDRQRLDAILLDASICKPKSQSRGDICTMIYRMPYAVLNENEQSVALGAANNGCEIPTDLCEGRGDELRVFVEALKSRIDSLSCQ